METLVAEADSVREGIGQTVVRNLKVMARMGTFLERRGPAHLSGISTALRRFFLGRVFAAIEQEFNQLAERYDSSPAALAAVR